MLPVALIVYMAVMITDGKFLPQNSEGAAPLYCLSFLIGSLLWLYRTRIPLHGMITLFFLILLAIGSQYGWFVYLYPLVIPYIVIYLATSPAMQRLGTGRIRNDYSYGIYLYGWPILQAFAQWFPHDMKIYLCGSYVSVIGLAALSWHFIEKPALRKRASLSSSQDSLKIPVG